MAREILVESDRDTRNSVVVRVKCRSVFAFQRSAQD